MALAGALSNGELGGLFPRSGGEYVYLREAYGPSVGFLSGWTSFWIAFPGSIAALAAGSGVTLGDAASECTTRGLRRPSAWRSIVDPDGGERRWARARASGRTTRCP